VMLESVESLAHWLRCQQPDPLPPDGAELHLRCCLDHLSGPLGGRIAEAMMARGYVAPGTDGLALTGEGDGWLAQMRATYASAARASARALEQPAPEGGTFLFFDLQPFMKRSEKLSDILDRCAEAGVLLTPGTSCGADFTTSARLCFTTVPEPDLHEALRRLRGVLFAQP